VDQESRSELQEGVPQSESETPPQEAEQERDTADESDDDLPKKEPLTPELVEDEAIRGDFMLRWAVVLLAFLMACTSIEETATLVHVKSGEYTWRNGLPARTGVFSSSAEDRPWANLSWLFDAVLAGVYYVGGAIGLSLFKAILAVVIFGVLVHINRKDVSTWWGTICAGLALFACHRQFTALPEIVTLLGTVLTLRYLHRFREERQTRPLKALVVLFVVWSNMDPGMFYGLAILLLYAVGETAGSWLGYSGLDSDRHRKWLWMTVGACLAATLLNPFGWDALLAPVVRYGSVYPAWQHFHSTIRGYQQLQYYPMTDPEFWEMIDAVGVTGLILLATALVTFGLNFRRLDFGDVVLWVGFAGFAVIATHELPLAALVSAVLATLNAQEYYRHNFRQTYSVNTGELVFSRLGRALTVLALFAVAYLSAFGLLKRRAGIGFHPDLQGAIDAFEADFQDVYDDRPFNFVPSQGDLLVWTGKKAFIDSRMSLYAGGEEDLIQLHEETRSALRAANQKGDAGRKWRPVLDRFKISHVVPRLDSRLVQPEPDFLTFFRLLSSRDWQLVGFGSTSALFCRTDQNDPELSEYVKSRRVDFVKQAFRTECEPPEVRVEWARGATFTDKYLSRPVKSTPNAVEEANHYFHLMERTAKQGFPEMDTETPAGSLPLILAFAHLAIRKANEGLEQAPRNAEAFRLLGYAYFLLGNVEQELIRRSRAAAQARFSQRRSMQLSRSLQQINERRYLQAVTAFSQSLIIEPDNLPTMRSLAHVQFFYRRYELAVQSYQRCIDLLDEQDDDEEAQKARESYVKRKEQSKESVERALQQVKAGMEELRRRIAAEDAQPGPGNYDEARMAMQVGCVNTAIGLLEDDTELIGTDPRVGYLYVDLLLQAGRIEQAAEELESLNSKMKGRQRESRWRVLEAYVALARADYAKARGIWQFEVQQLDSQRVRRIMDTAALAVRSPNALVQGLNQPNRWVPHQVRQMAQAFEAPFQMADRLLQAALAELEAGQPEAAAKSCREIVRLAPESPLRPLAGVYLLLITGEQLAPLPAPKRKPPAVRPPVEAPKPRQTR